MTMRVDNAQSMSTWDVELLAGLGIGASVTQGIINMTGYQRIRGAVRQDAVAGVPGMVVNFRARPQGPVVMTYDVPVDAAQPNFTYSWDIIVLFPYVELVFTNGAGPSTFFRAHNVALPT